MTRSLRRPAVPWRALALLTALALGPAACDVEWGGGWITLEDPSPPTPEAVVEGEAPPAPLPDGPLLYMVGLREDGRATLAPIARITGDSLASLELPSPIDEEYRARFEAAFLRPGAELALVAGGARVGSLIIETGPAAAPADCPSAGVAQAVLPPGAYMPSLGFGVPLDMAPVELGRATPREPVGRMATYGPILAEQLLRADGVARPFLAQRAALEAVPSGDSLRSMAATYLINDTLAAAAPRGEAASLFFLARDEVGRGFVPVWREVRSYRTAEEKQAFAYVDWLELAGARFDFVRLIESEGERLSASRAPSDWRERTSLAERELVWTEDAGCAARGLLSSGEAP